MLDVMRKHASSWMIKVILGAIIVSFVLFFGYNRINRARQTAARAGIAEGKPVATVNGVGISLNEFEFFLGQNMERLKSTFKGENVPEGIKSFAESMTLNQLLRRELSYQMAEKIGIIVPDEELASVIRKDIEAMRGGEFDPIFYRHQYLPYFQDRYGINYEEMVRHDVAINTLESTFADVDENTTGDKENKIWTFEIVNIKADTPNAKTIAEIFINQTKDWKAIADKNKIEIKKVGPITISERGQILNGTSTFDDHKKIFSLNKENPVLKTPIEHTDSIFVVRLVEVKDLPANPSSKGGEEFLANWMQQEMRKAKIVNYLETSSK